MPEKLLKLRTSVYKIICNYVIVISQAWSESELYTKVISRRH